MILCYPKIYIQNLPKSGRKKSETPWWLAKPKSSQREPRGHHHVNPVGWFLQKTGIRRITSALAAVNVCVCVSCSKRKDTWLHIIRDHQRKHPLIWKIKKKTIVTSLHSLDPKILTVGFNWSKAFDTLTLFLTTPRKGRCCQGFKTPTEEETIGNDAADELDGEDTLSRRNLMTPCCTFYDNVSYWLDTTFFNMPKHLGPWHLVIHGLESTLYTPTIKWLRPRSRRQSRCSARLAGCDKQGENKKWIYREWESKNR